MGNAAELCAEHMQLARAIASDYLRNPLPRHVYPDDIHSAAMLGLFQAAHSFDETRGVAFGAWARLRINGAIMDDMRRMVPAYRSTFKHMQDYAAAWDSLASELGGTPDRGAIAARLGCTEDDIERWQVDATRTDVLYLQGFASQSVCDQAMSNQWVGTPEDTVISAWETSVRAEDVRSAVAGLHPKMRAAIDGRYLHPRSTADVAADLGGVSATRVSQILKQALSELRDTLVTA